MVAALLRPGDLIVTLGAGSVGSLGPRVLAALEGRA
jgi:UDP-N-acetylmuramate-alanine ligase